MTTTEKFTVKGNQVIDKVKQLIHEGNIRRVRLLHEGRTILEIPLSIGAPAAAITIMAAPLLAALGGKDGHNQGRDPAEWIIDRLITQKILLTTLHSGAILPLA